MKLSISTVKDLRAKKPTELTSYINSLEENLLNLVHAINTNKDKQTHQIGQIKKAIAQAKTIQVEQAKKEEK